MKPLTKTVVSRGGGIAARYVAAKPIVQKPKRRDDPPAPARAEPTRPKQGSGGAAVAVKSKDRVTRWREANPELYLERQREYMRKRRAGQKK